MKFKKSRNLNSRRSKNNDLSLNFPPLTEKADDPIK